MYFCLYTCVSTHACYFIIAYLVLLNTSCSCCSIDSIRCRIIVPQHPPLSVFLVKFSLHPSIHPLSCLIIFSSGTLFPSHFLLNYIRPFIFIHYESIHPFLSSFGESLLSLDSYITKLRQIIILPVNYIARFFSFIKTFDK